jgi:hypothetical protein
MAMNNHDTTPLSELRKNALAALVAARELASSVQKLVYWELTSLSDEEEQEKTNGQSFRG